MRERSADTPESPEGEEINLSDLTSWYVCGTQDGRLLLTHVACDWSTLRENRLSVPVGDIMKLILEHCCG